MSFRTISILATVAIGGLLCLPGTARASDLDACGNISVEAQAQYDAVAAQSSAVTS